MSADAIARDLADSFAGADYAELAARCEAAHRALEGWHAAYQIALADPRHQLALSPPYTVGQTAVALAIGESSVRELIRTGQIKTVAGIGDVIRISQAEIHRRLTPAYR